MKTMTSKQSWAIFCFSKIDVRNAAIDMEKASQLIEALKSGGEKFKAAIEELKKTEGVVIKGTAKPKEDWQALYNRAHEAGMKAGQEIIPETMIVQQRANPLDDNSPIAKQWVVPEGVCGFAWITIHPGNCSFALWLKKNDLAHKAYQGGMQVWVSYFNQSMTRKEAYASAFADVIQQAGITAYAGSRMD